MIEETETRIDLHTPGPWYVLYDTNVFGIRRDTETKGCLANVAAHFSNRIDCSIENKANAKLIAAAPDLLASCVEMCNMLIASTTRGVHHENPAAVLVRASEAIAKARGQ